MQRKDRSLGERSYWLLPGQYFDRETNTHYNYFRDYDPAQGRYIESDPIGLTGGINGYGYVESDPLDLVDPMGLMGQGPGAGQARAPVRANLVAMQNMAAIAYAYRGSQQWNNASPQQWNGQFGVGTNKCNLFVWTVINQAGLQAPTTWCGAANQKSQQQCTPSAAAQWGVAWWAAAAGSNVPDWPVYTGNLGAIPPGSVVSSGPHVGVYIGNGQVVSATPSSGVTLNGLGAYGSNPTVRVYTGP